MMSTRLAVPPSASFERDSPPLAGLIFVGLLVVLVGIGLGLTLYPPLAFLAAVPVGLLLVNWLWRRPERGVYLLVGATLVFEIYPLNFPDSLTDRVPFFLNLNNSQGLSGVSITPAEILMLAVIGIWLATGTSRRTLTLEKGPLLSSYLAFAAVVVAGEIHGIVLSHGDWGKSLWEVRPQAYGFIAFLLAGNLINDRRQVRNLIVVFFAAVALKIGVALFRYYVTLHGSNGGYDALMAHEESYFYALVILGTAAVLVWGRGLNRRVVFVLLVLSALALVAMAINQRRAAELALIGGAGALGVLAIRFDSERRAVWVVLAAALTIGFAGFVFAYWNHTTGISGELVRPIRSLFEPDQRDYLSNIYRNAEDANLLYTFRTNPVFGIGFGIPMTVIFPMADISYIYPLWNYIPHNTLLWIGMRMGTIGYAAFFGLIAMAFLQAGRQLLTKRDPLLNGFAAFAVAAIVAEMVMGYSDLQLDSYRNLIVFGVILGILSRLPKLADE